AHRPRPAIRTEATALPPPHATHSRHERLTSSAQSSTFEAERSTYGVTSMELYLVRHGESEIPPDTFQSDFPLSDLGRKQATAVAGRFRDISIDHLLTTPYQRTQATAEAIAGV